MNRRSFIRNSVSVAGAVSILPSAAFSYSKGATTFIANYDTESKSCLEHLETIVTMHLKHQVPATFFVVAGIINDTNKHRVVKLLDNPLFEIGSHSYNHQVVMPHPLANSVGNPRIEIVDSKKKLEDVFGKELTGFAAPYAYTDGFVNQKHILELVQEAGYKYTSSMCWGPDYSLPAPILESFTYEKDGFADVTEIPKHGWHENILKGHTDVSKVKVLQWPSAWPDAAIPKSFVKTPREEFLVNQCFLDLAKKQNKKHLTLAWHPWSIGRMDKDMKVLDLTFDYAKKQGFNTSTFRDFYKTLQA